MKLFIYALFILAISSLSFADESKFKMTAIYIGIAEQMFEHEHPDQLGNFVSVKGTPDGNNVNVKVSLVTGQSLNYFCMMMPQPMCHAPK